MNKQPLERPASTWDAMGQSEESQTCYASSLEQILDASDWRSTAPDKGSPVALAPPLLAQQVNERWKERRGQSEGSKIRKERSTLIQSQHLFPVESLSSHCNRILIQLRQQKPNQTPSEPAITSIASQQEHHSHVAPVQYYLVALDGIQGL